MSAKKRPRVFSTVQLLKERGRLREELDLLQFAWDKAESSVSFLSTRTEIKQQLRAIQARIDLMDLLIAEGNKKVA